MQERRQQLEQDIARAEADIAGYEQSVQTFVSAEESVRVTSLIEQRRGELAKLIAGWEEVSHALEAVK